MTLRSRIIAAILGLLLVAPAGSVLAADSSIAPMSVTRALTEADLGVKGTITELKGTFSVANGQARASVDMIRGEINNPFEIINNLSNTARANGANTIRIEGTLANERLYNVLTRRYGLTSEGATDVITIPLKGTK